MSQADIGMVSCNSCGFTEYPLVELRVIPISLFILIFLLVSNTFSEM